MKKTIIYTVSLIFFITGCSLLDPRETAMNNGEELFKKNLFDQAALSYLSAAELADDNTAVKAEALLHAGDCQFKNDPVKAKKTFSQILILQVSSKKKIDAQIRIAQCLLADGDFDSALTSTKELLEIPEISKKQNAEVYYIRGESFHRTRQFSLSIECFEKALANKELNAIQRQRIYSFMGNIYMRTNHMTPDETHEKFLQLEKNIDANESLAWFGVLNALTTPQHVKEVNEICQRILKNNPSDGEKKYALMYQSRILLVIHNYGEAAEAYERFCLQYPALDKHENAGIKLEWGIATARNKKYNDALDIFKQVLELDDITCSPMAQLMIGYCYFELNDFSNSLNAFKQVTTMPSLKSQYKLVEEAKRQIIKCEEKL